MRWTGREGRKCRGAVDRERRGWVSVKGLVLVGRRLKEEDSANYTHMMCPFQGGIMEVNKNRLKKVTTP